MSDATISALPGGAIFYLDEHPGNKYRLLNQNRAEFVQHRLGNHLNGKEIGVYPSLPVSLEPINEDDLSLL